MKLWRNYNLKMCDLMLSRNRQEWRAECLAPQQYMVNKPKGRLGLQVHKELINLSKNKSYLFIFSFSPPGVVWLPQTPGVSFFTCCEPEHPCSSWRAQTHMHLICYLFIENWSLLRGLRAAFKPNLGSYLWAFGAHSLNIPEGKRL